MCVFIVFGVFVFVFECLMFVSVFVVFVEFFEDIVIRVLFAD